MHYRRDELMTEKGAGHVRQSLSSMASRLVSPDQSKPRLPVPIRVSPVWRSLSAPAADQPIIMVSALLQRCAGQAQTLRSTHQHAGTAIRASRPQQLRQARRLSIVAKVS